jgi:hypothetical protein
MLVLSGKISSGVLTACSSQPKDNESSFAMAWWSNGGKIGQAVVNDLATVR